MASPSIAAACAVAASVLCQGTLAAAPVASAPAFLAFPDAAGLIATCTWSETALKPQSIPSCLLNVRVANNDFTFGDFYSVSSATFSTVGNSGIIAVGTTVAKSDTDVGKAFNIWDVLVDGEEFVGSKKKAPLIARCRLSSRP